MNLTDHAFQSQTGHSSIVCLQEVHHPMGVLGVVGGVAGRRLWGGVAVMAVTVMEMS